MPLSHLCLTKKLHLCSQINHKITYFYYVASSYHITSSLHFCLVSSSTSSIINMYDGTQRPTVKSHWTHWTIILYTSTVRKHNDCLVETPILTVINRLMGGFTGVNFLPIPRSLVRLVPSFLFAPSPFTEKLTAVTAVTEGNQINKNLQSRREYFSDVI